MKPDRDWRSIRCPFDDPDFPRGHYARYNADLDVLACEVCQSRLGQPVEDGGLTGAQVEDLVGDKLAELADRWPRLGILDPRVGQEVEIAAARAKRGRLEPAEVAALVEAWALRTYAHVSPGLIRHAIRRGLAR